MERNSRMKEFSTEVEICAPKRIGTQLENGQKNWSATRSQGNNLQKWSATLE